MKTILFNVELLIRDKNEEFIVSDNEAVRWLVIHHFSHAPEYIRKYIEEVDFSKYVVIILWVKTAETIRQEKTENLFTLIKEVTGVSKKEICSYDRGEVIVFARQLFHYGFLLIPLGTVAETARASGKARSSVDHSLKVIANLKETDKHSWRREILTKLESNLKTL